MKGELKFIADVHLGKLARMLRLLGFDTLYKNAYTAMELVTISAEQKRVLLSKNAALAKKNGIKCLVISSEDPFEQPKQVIEDLDLKEHFRPFSRCLLCNGILEAVDKANIIHLLEQNTLNYYHEFWQCQNCKHIYWKGSHYERMLKTIESISS